MEKNLDPVWLLLIGAGFSDKRVKETLTLLAELDDDSALKRFRALKRAIANAQKIPPPRSRTIEDDISDWLKLLRAAGPFSESEVIAALAMRSHPSLFLTPTSSKGSLKQWLERAASELGQDDVGKLVTRVRNDLAHDKRPGWTTKDLR